MPEKLAAAHVKCLSFTTWVIHAQHQGTSMYRECRQQLHTTVAAPVLPKEAGGAGKRGVSARAAG